MIIIYDLNDLIYLFAYDIALYIFKICIIFPFNCKSKSILHIVIVLLVLRLTDKIPDIS